MQRFRPREKPRQFARSLVAKLGKPRYHASSVAGHGCSRPLNFVRPSLRILIKSRDTTVNRSGSGPILSVESKGQAGQGPICVPAHRAALLHCSPERWCSRAVLPRCSDWFRTSRCCVVGPAMLRCDTRYAALTSHRAQRYDSATHVSLPSDRRHRDELRYDQRRHGDLL